MSPLRIVITLAAALLIALAVVGLLADELEYSKSPSTSAAL